MQRDTGAQNPAATIQSNALCTHMGPIPCRCYSDEYHCDGRGLPLGVRVRAVASRRRGRRRGSGSDTGSDAGSGSPATRALLPRRDHGPRQVWRRSVDLLQERSTNSRILTRVPPTLLSFEDSFSLFSHAHFLIHLVPLCSCFRNVFPDNFLTVTFETVSCLKFCVRPHTASKVPTDGH